MTTRERELARRMTEFVDGIIVHRRRRELYRRGPEARDDEFTALTRLADRLSRIEIVAPPNFTESLLSSLPRLAAAETEPASRLRRWSAQTSGRWARLALPPWLLAGLRAHAAVAAIAAATGIAVLLHVPDGNAVSAAEVLSRAEAALVKLVAPGRVLYRRWRIVDARRDRGAAGDSLATRYVEEWMDGTDHRRTAGRFLATDGEVLLAYARALDEGEYRARVYFAPGFSNEPKGLLSIEPSRREFFEAVKRFHPSQRPMLEEYVDRGYIWEPILSDQRFNRSMMEGRGGRVLPRVVLSLDPSARINGTAVYAVRLVDPLRVRFRWRSVGPPTVWLARLETVRYIARDTYLSLAVEEAYDHEDGRRVVSRWELLESRLLEAAHLRGSDDPFSLAVPAGVPIRRQSAFEQLAEVVRALERAPRWLTRSLPRPIAPVGDGER